MSGTGAMEGGGYYAAHSEPQKDFGELAYAWLAEAAAAVPRPAAGAPFVVADLGAAGGGNSLEPMRRAIAAHRDAGGAGPVLVVHTDIPTDDFTALFQLVESSPDSYLRAPDVYALAAGRSFYERLLPDGLLSLGWSSIAVHWLSAVPEPIPGHVYCTFARGAVRDAFRERSARDWEAFLGHRAAELAPGGRLIVIGGASAEDGASGADGMMAMADAALGTLVGEGLLREEERARMTIPTWNRTTAEFLAPFAADGGGAAAGLRLRRHAFRTLADPYHGRFAADGDRAAYAAAEADFFHAAFEPSLWAALDADRDEPARDALHARFREELVAAVAADPDAAACTWHVVLLDIERVS